MNGATTDTHLVLSLPHSTHPVFVLRDKVNTGNFSLRFASFRRCSHLRASPSLHSAVLVPWCCSRFSRHTKTSEAVGVLLSLRASGQHQSLIGGGIVVGHRH